MSVYVICSSGYESYEPHYFECDCSEEEFKEEVKAAIDKAVPKLIEEDAFICGHYILEKAVKILSKKFKYLSPDYTESIDGECVYSDSDKKPEAISEEAWQKIIKQNDDIRSNLYKEQL